MLPMHCDSERMSARSQDMQGTLCRHLRSACGGCMRVPGRGHAPLRCSCQLVPDSAISMAGDSSGL